MPKLMSKKKKQDPSIERKGHGHYCVSCDTSYMHDADDCTYDHDHLCAACWEFFRLGQLHPGWKQRHSTS